MQVCISLQTDNHASTPPLKSFLQAGCPSCRPTNSIKALKAKPYLVQLVIFDIISISLISEVIQQDNVVENFFQAFSV